MKGRAAACLVALCALGASAIGGAEEPSPLDAIASNPPSPATVAAPRAAISAQTPNDLDRALAQLDAQDAELSRQLAEIQPAIDLTHTRMLARGRAYYRYVRAGLLPIGGGFEALVDHAARVERTRQALERDLATEKALTKRGAQLAERLTRLRTERAPLEVHREAMQRARTALVEAEERRNAFARAFESSARPPDYLAIYGADTGPTDVDTRLGFRALRGRLPFPITGRAEIRRVTRTGGPGLEIGASLGSAVRSVGAGRVVFADVYDDYGKTIILDHGDSYYSVYAELGGIDATLGSTIASGTRIGSVGAGEGSGPVIYFELRKGGQTIDPAPWLGL